MKIVISETMEAGAVKSLADKYDVLYDAKLVDQPHVLSGVLGDADAWIVRNRQQVRGDLLAAARKVRVIGRLGVGLDNIDMSACAARGIEVYPATGANALAVAEYVVAMSMVLLRGAYSSTAAVAAGKFPRMALSEGREIHGKTLGIVGFGGIGRLTGRLARALGMRTIACDANVPDDSTVWGAESTACRNLDPLLWEADVVSLHVPLLDATRNLLDAGRLAKMKRGAILINTARGGIVDEPALIAALQSGALGGAALDVYAQEPLPAGTHWATTATMGLNLILTPHIGGVTAESNVRVSTMIAEKVDAFLSR